MFLDKELLEMCRAKDCSIPDKALDLLGVKHCPVCKSENIIDSSTFADNGIMGSGYASWKINDIRSCKDCGILFLPTIHNKA